MKEIKAPSIASVFVAGSLWWGAIAAASIAAAQPATAVLASAVAVAQLWGASKFTGFAADAELRSSAVEVSEQRQIVSERAAKAA
ncbi:MAG TPA: hypothetical protein VHS06_07015 [Chloroflexota bacterium]|nr:hypothetical protein [Chloroflexota bacterium]HEX2987905.1 hypothetical protein [Chloroflexota bacterium]